MDRLWSAIWSNAPVAQGLAGWLNQEQGWRWVFWINIPLSVVVLALVIWLLPASPRAAARVDYTGGALIAASLASMTLGLGDESGSQTHCWSATCCCPPRLWGSSYDVSYPIPSRCCR